MKHESYEVCKVFNGYMVLLLLNYRESGFAINMEDVHVFETWEKCSEWLRQQFMGQA